jgi:hypothetical protein
MESIPRIKPDVPRDDRQRLFDIFFDIERKARLSGNAEVLLQLDRIPGLVLGAANRVSEGAEDTSLSQAFAALEHILSNLEQPQAAIAG